MSTSSSPHVGAEDSRRVIEALSTADDAPIVVVRGPAGSGKTSLVRALLATLSDPPDASAVRVVTASPSSPMPFSALAPLLPDANPDVLSASALGEAIQRSSTGSAGTDGSLRPTLLIDDAAHLDDASAALLQQIGLAATTSMLFTIRDGHSLPEALASLLTARSHTTIAMTPLHADEIAELATNMLAGPLDDTSLHALVNASRGNPLYIRELLTGARGAGAVVETNGVWRFTTHLRTSPLLEELIVARLGPLSDDERQLVELVAVGGPLELDLVLHGHELAVVETMENRNILVITDDERVDLIHPLYGEVVLAGVGRLTRQRRFAELARLELEARAVRPDGPWSTLRSAVWHVRGGLSPGHDALLAAAQLALSSSDPWLAVELAGQAFTEGRRADAALVAAAGLAATGRHDEAADLLRGAMASTTDPWMLTAVRLRLSEELWWWAHDLDGARALLSRSASDVEADADPSSGILTAQLGVFATLDGDLETAAAICGPLVDHPALLVRFVAAIGQTHALAAYDRAEAALDVAQRTYDESIATDEPLLGDPGIHLINQIMALLHAGRLDDARLYAELINDVAAQQPALIAKAWASLMFGFALDHVWRRPTSTGEMQEFPAFSAGRCPAWHWPTPRPAPRLRLRSFAHDSTS